MLRRIELEKVQDNTTSFKEAKEQFTIAKNKWEEFKNKAHKYREAELLDYYDRELVGDTPKVIEKRRKALKSVKDKMKRNYMFSYLTQMVGKPKNSLLKLRVIDPRTKEMRTIYGRKEIEKALI